MTEEFFKVPGVVDIGRIHRSRGQQPWNPPPASVFEPVRNIFGDGSRRWLCNQDLIDLNCPINFFWPPINYPRSQEPPNHGFQVNMSDISGFSRRQCSNRDDLHLGASKNFSVIEFEIGLGNLHNDYFWEWTTLFWDGPRDHFQIGINSAPRDFMNFPVHN